MFRISKFVLETQKLRIVLEDYEGFTKEIIEVKDKDTWVPILKSFDQNSTLRVWNKEDISTKSLHFLKEKKKKLYFQLKNMEIIINNKSIGKYNKETLEDGFNFIIEP